MSMADRPGVRPAPDMACSEVATTCFTPKVSRIGLSETTSPAMVQLDLGEMNPFQPRFFCWTASSAACSMLTPPTKMGVSGS